MTALKLQNVSLSWHDQPPLIRDFGLVATAGQIVTVMGSSGAGKSTLLDFVGGHLGRGWRTAGRVILGGRDVTYDPAENRHIGILFQDAVLFPHLSVGENLAFGLGSQTRGHAMRRAAVEQALDQAGLAGFYGRDPATLSGGQRARAALMRTLLAEPRALLLDEPFGSLDAELRAEIRAFVFDHVRSAAIPALMVTHDSNDSEAAEGPIVRL